MSRTMLRFFRLLAILALTLAAPIGLLTARSARSAQQSGELLINSGFDEPFTAQGGDIFVANGWQAWYVVPDGATYPLECPGEDPNCKPYRVPYYKATQPQNPRVPARAVTGNSQQWGTQYAIHIAGVYQQVSNLQPGTRLRFSAQTQGFNCSDNRGCFGSAGEYGKSYEAGDMRIRVGIDPAGGANPFSPNIVWSGYANPLDAFVLQSVEAVTQGDTATVFVSSAPTYPELHTEVYVDDASLIAVGQGSAPTQAAQPTPPAGTPGPVPTLPAGTTTYTIVAGDTLYAIALRFNLTLDQLLALNPNLTGQSILQVGQAINVAGQAPTAASTAQTTNTPPASPTLAPTQTSAPAATPTPAATTSTAVTAVITSAAGVTPTPAIVVFNSGLCMQAFDDLNGNLVRDTGEALVAGVGFEIKSLDGQATTTYTTDGQQEPHCIGTLPDGRYSVNTQLPDDRTATTDSAWQLALLSGTNVSLALGTRLDASPTPEPTAAPTALPTTTAAAVERANTNNSAPLALLGGGALILLAGVALFFGLRSRQKSA
jgi:LysM repeat protein